MQVNISFALCPLQFLKCHCVFCAVIKGIFMIFLESKCLIEYSGFSPSGRKVNTDFASWVLFHTSIKNIRILNVLLVHNTSMLEDFAWGQNEFSGV